MDDKRDDKPDGKSDDIQTSRREAIKRISMVVGGGIASAIVLPSNWTKPVMDSVIGPVSARGFISFCDPDGTFHTRGVIYPPGSPGNNCPVPPTTS